MRPLSCSVAQKKRTFACVVGTYGLSGWITSETPVASHCASASSGRCAVALARQLRAHHVREIDAGLLEDRAVAQHAALAAAAFGALPSVTTKARAAVRLLERVADAVLQSAQVGQNGIGTSGADAAPCTTSSSVCASPVPSSSRRESSPALRARLRRVRLSWLRPSPAL